MSARLPIVVRRKLTRARRRAWFRARAVPVLLVVCNVADAIASFARYDYSAPVPDAALNADRLARFMSHWGRTTP